LATNVFLTLVNVVGIWRWLGRQRGYEDGGKSAEKASRQISTTPDLLAATRVVGAQVRHADGTAAGKAVEALFECGTAQISYVVVSRTIPGGIREELRAVPRDTLAFARDGLMLNLTPSAFSALPLLDDGDWPAAPPAIGGTPVDKSAAAANGICA
jgi:hypothetical protein